MRIVLNRNLLMLSAMNCCSSLERMFQYCQNILMNSLSDNNLSVLWLGFMLIISDKGSIKTPMLSDLYLFIFSLKGLRV